LSKQQQPNRGKNISNQQLLFAVILLEVMLFQSISFSEIWTTRSR
jgi:hypothetical protein